MLDIISRTESPCKVPQDALSEQAEVYPGNVDICGVVGDGVKSKAGVFTG